MSSKETISQAQQAMNAEVEKIIGACTQELNAVLDKYECTLDASMIMTAQGNIPNIRVVLRQGALANNQPDLNMNREAAPVASTAENEAPAE